MFTTIIKVKAFGPLSFVVASVAIAMAVDAANAQSPDIKVACEQVGGSAQEFAVMRDTGFDMVTAMNYFMEREKVTEQRHIEWVYTLATIAYENWEETPEDIGYAVFLSCMDLVGEVY